MKPKIGVGVMIIENNKILLALRNADKIKEDSEIKTMECETILECQWFDLNDLPLNIYKPSKKCIEKYKSKVIYE